MGNISSKTLNAQGKRRISLKKKACFLLVLFLILVVGVEVAFRLFSYAKARYIGRVKDAELGWKTLPGISWELNRPGYGKIKYSTQKYGFRRFGNPKSNKFKVFVIGDSYTHGTTVNDGETFYDILQKLNPNLEFFAYGCGGYGNLQEFMILQRHFEEIQPDLILLQLTENDIMNNVYEIERKSIHNNLMTRPYLIDGKVELRYPYRDVNFSSIVFRHMRSWRFIALRLNVLKKPQDFKHYISAYDTLREPKMLNLAETNTSAIFAKFRTLAKDKPIVAFMIGSKPAYAFYKQILEKKNIYITHEVENAVRKASKAGKKIDGTPHDVHWNALGHQIAGKKLLEILQSNNYIPVTK